MSRRGTNVNTPTGQCMVVGCGRRALYRISNGSRANRGYCSEHRAMAVPAEGVREYQVDMLARNAAGQVTFQRQSQYGWIPKHKD